MTSTTERLDRLEQALPPLEAVLVWLAEAHAEDDLNAYVRSIIDVPPEQMPRSQIVDRVEAFERGRHGGGRQQDIDAAVKQAVREAVFRYELVLVLETAAATFALRYDAVMMLMLHRLVDEIDECRRADEDGLSCVSRHWAPGAAAQAIEIYEEERDARLSLEEQYLGGRSALFPRTADAWDRLERHAEVIRNMSARRFAGADDPGPAPGPDDADQADPVPRRADDLRDEALMSTHEFFGESDQARAIVRRQIMATR